LWNEILSDYCQDAADSSVSRSGFIEARVGTMSSVAVKVRVQEVEAKQLPPLPTTSPRRNPDTLALVGPSRIAQAVGMIMVAAIAAGFVLKSREIFVPSEGIGYKLGLIGGSMMMLILLYPMVKRVKFFSEKIKPAFWFRWHMMLGTVGPILIFYHSNFSTGATNSNIALFVMIMVAGSGVIGRYIYGQVHNGMSGAKLDVGGLLAKATRLMGSIEGDVGGGAGSLAKLLAEFSESALPKSSKLMPSFLNILSLPLKISFARTRIMTEVRRTVSANAKSQNWSRSAERSHINQARVHVLDFLNAVSRAAQLTLWERMFSLWHLFHVPLFFLLIVSGVIHVIAVHLY
jgi:hypothetical protein